MTKLFIDFFIFCKFKLKESEYKFGFFCESNFIFHYLEPYILNKSKKVKVIILCFENIHSDLIDKSAVFVFRTNFFRQLVFLTLKLNVLYSSTPDLNNTIFQRSKFSKCKYIYLHHTPVSLTLIYNPNAFDAFDAVQSISTYQYREMKEIIFKKKLNTRTFKSKYLVINKQIEKNKTQTPDSDLLIAPSWNSDFYKLNCHILLKKFLTKSKLSYRLKPHPMSIRKGEISMNDLKRQNIPTDNLDFPNLHKYRFLITDWSGIFIEFAFLFKRKAFLINTTKKMRNKNYLNFENKPIEISLRNVFAKTYEIQNIQNIVKEIEILKNEIKEINNISEDESIKKIISENFY